MSELNAELLRDLAERVAREPGRGPTHLFILGWACVKRPDGTVSIRRFDDEGNVYGPEITDEEHAALMARLTEQETK